nr:MAG TPA: AAA domain protein [Caudoviricetes sp.]
MILPKNEPKKADVTPKNILIWGESMSGKTYLAKQFESPLIINTDGNASKITTPSVFIKNFTEFKEVIEELEKGKHTFKTLIIDLIDDLETMVINHICSLAKVESLADIAFGKGFNTFNSIWKNLMMTLTQMNLNVIFISHIVEKIDGQSSYQAPALSQKCLNACMGRCDIVIKTQKIGNNYIRLCTSKREAYKEEDITDENVLKILKTIKNIFSK